MTLETVWFLLLALSAAVYVVLDGFDLGVGIASGLVARDAEERRLLLRTIEPVWDGNVVWLVATGATLFAVFPVLFGTAFAGFYLPLMIVLWLLALRGLSIELRHRSESAVLTRAIDAVFFGSSAMLALVLGVALGNVVRGVPLDAEGGFFVPLWTDLWIDGAAVGALDGYTLLVGVTALVGLAGHGALWAALKLGEDLRARLLRFGARALVGAALLLAGATVLTLRVQPQAALNVRAHPGGVALPVLGVAGLVAGAALARRASARAAFACTSAALAALVGCAAFGIHPFVLPVHGGRGAGLTIAAAAASPHALRTALFWWPLGMALTAAYFAFSYHRFRGRADADDHGA